MIVSLDLSLCSPMSPTSSPSMAMCPPADSMMRKSARVREDFPAPVRPTMPTCVCERAYSTDSV